jgi:hypothetical protein
MSDPVEAANANRNFFVNNNNNLPETYSIMNLQGGSGVYAPQFKYPDLSADDTEVDEVSGTNSSSATSSNSAPIISEGLMNFGDKLGAAFGLPGIGTAIGGAINAIGSICKKMS